MPELFPVENENIIINLSLAEFAYIADKWMLRSEIWFMK